MISYRRRAAASALVKDKKPKSEDLVTRLCCLLITFTIIFIVLRPSTQAVNVPLDCRGRIISSMNNRWKRIRQSSPFHLTWRRRYDYWFLPVAAAASSTTSSSTRTCALPLASICLVDILPQTPKEIDSSSLMLIRMSHYKYNSFPLVVFAS